MDERQVLESLVFLVLDKRRPPSHKKSFRFDDRSFESQELQVQHFAKGCGAELPPTSAPSTSITGEAAARKRVPEFLRRANLLAIADGQLGDDTVSAKWSWAVRGEMLGLSIPVWKYDACHQIFQ